MTIKLVINRMAKDGEVFISGDIDPFGQAFQVDNLLHYYYSDNTSPDLVICTFSSVVIQRLENELDYSEIFVHLDGTDCALSEYTDIEQLTNFRISTLWSSRLLLNRFLKFP